MGYFLAPFSTKSDFGSFFLAAVVSLAIVDDPVKDGAGGGSRTHTALRPTDFLASTAFAALSEKRPATLRQGSGSGLSLHPPPEVPGLRCCPSSLYTFLRQEAWLGIAS